MASSRLIPLARHPKGAVFSSSTRRSGGSSANDPAPSQAERAKTGGLSTRLLRMTSVQHKARSPVYGLRVSPVGASLLPEDAFLRRTSNQPLDKTGVGALIDLSSPQRSSWTHSRIAWRDSPIMASPRFSPTDIPSFSPDGEQLQVLHMDDVVRAKARRDRKTRTAAEKIAEKRS